MPRHELLSDGAPDAGLAAIAAGFAAQAGPLGVEAGAEADVRGSEAHAQPHRPRPADIWPLRLPVLFLNAAGTIDGAINDWGPPPGRAWEINTLVITFGTGTTLVQIYDEAAQPANLLFQTATGGLLDLGHKILLHGERLLFVSTGGGMTIRLFEGIQMSADYLPTHLT